MAFFITGDCHGNFRRIKIFCNVHPYISREDTMILLGDVGLNYHLNSIDKDNKKLLSKLPLTFLCVHGNHEERPFNIESYQEKEWRGGIVYYEPEFPYILFAKDGEIYDFNGKKAVAIGGAYSVDMEFRIRAGLPWFENEQPSKEIKNYVETRLEEERWEVDYVFSHTCPFKYEPTELFADFVEQEEVDKSTEIWMDEIESKLSYKKWYFGHYHGNLKYSHMELLYEVVKELDQADFLQKIGRPQYREGQTVLFNYDGKEGTMECYGKIIRINKYGTKKVPDEVSYDICGPNLEEQRKQEVYEDVPESVIEAII